MLTSMKKTIILFMAVVFVLSSMSVAFAGENRQGTIKGIDTENRTIVFCPAGTEDHITLSVAEGIDLGKFKPETRVKIYVEGEMGKEMVKGIKLDKRKVIVGC